MSSWDTNPKCNFYASHWELICQKKWNPGTSEISTLLEIALWTHFHAWYGTKTTMLFSPTDAEASWSLLPNSVPLLSVSVQPENTYSCTLKATGQVWESWKSITINTKPVSTDLTIKSDSVLTNPTGKDEVWAWLM